MGYGTTRMQVRPHWSGGRTAAAEWRKGPQRLPRPIPPRVPASNKDRRRMTKATYHFLALAVGRNAGELRAMPTDRIFDLVNATRQHQGEARRLLAKLIRLEPGRPATA